MTSHMFALSADGATPLQSSSPVVASTSNALIDKIATATNTTAVSGAASAESNVQVQPKKRHVSFSIPPTSTLLRQSIVRRQPPSSVVNADVIASDAALLQPASIGATNPSGATASMATSTTTSSDDAKSTSTSSSTSPAAVTTSISPSASSSSTSTACCFCQSDRYDAPTVKCVECTNVAHHLCVTVAADAKKGIKDVNIAWWQCDQCAAKHLPPLCSICNMHTSRGAAIACSICDGSVHHPWCDTRSAIIRSDVAGEESMMVCHRCLTLQKESSDSEALVQRTSRPQLIAPKPSPTVAMPSPPTGATSSHSAPTSSSSTEFVTASSLVAAQSSSSIAAIGVDLLIVDPCYICASDSLYFSPTVKCRLCAHVAHDTCSGINRQFPWVCDQCGFDSVKCHGCKRVEFNGEPKHRCGGCLTSYHTGCGGGGIKPNTHVYLCGSCTPKQFTQSTLMAMMKKPPQGVRSKSTTVTPTKRSAPTSGSKSAVVTPMKLFLPSPPAVMTSTFTPTKSKPIVKIRLNSAVIVPPTPCAASTTTPAVSRAPLQPSLSCSRCRLTVVRPNAAGSDGDNDGIECNRCHTVAHRTCMNIPAAAGRNDPWQCSQCSAAKCRQCESISPEAVQCCVICSRDYHASCCTNGSELTDGNGFMCGCTQEESADRPDGHCDDIDDQANVAVANTIRSTVNETVSISLHSIDDRSSTRVDVVSSSNDANRRRTIAEVDHDRDAAAVDLNSSAVMIVEPKPIELAGSSTRVDQERILIEFTDTEDDDSVHHPASTTTVAIDRVGAAAAVVHASDLRCDTCFVDWVDQNQSNITSKSVRRHFYCGHSFCTGCIERLMVDGSAVLAPPDLTVRLFKCPICISVVTICNPLSTSSIAVMAQQFHTDRQAMNCFARVGAQIPSAVDVGLARSSSYSAPVASSGGQPNPPICSFDNCPNVATLFCTAHCGDICTNHDRNEHGVGKLFASHTRVPIATKEQTQQRLRRATRDLHIATEARRLQSAVTKLNKERSAYYTSKASDAAQVHKLMRMDSRSTLMRRSLKSHEQMISRMKSSISADDREDQLRFDKQLRVDDLECAQHLEDSLRLVDLRKLSAEETVERAAEFEAIISHRVDYHRWDDDPLVPYYGIDSFVNTIKPKMMGHLANIDLGGDRHDGATNGQELLQSWMPANMLLAKAVLIYRGPIDISTLKKTCGGVGPTLTILKTGRNVLCGLFSVSSWPRLSNSKSKPDESNGSFVFTVAKNRTHHEEDSFCLQLDERTEAIHILGTKIQLGEGYLELIETGRFIARTDEQRTMITPRPQPTTMSRPTMTLDGTCAETEPSIKTLLDFEVYGWNME